MMRPIIRNQPEIKFLRLEPRTRLQVLISLSKQLMPIAQATRQTASVNVIEFLMRAERPITLRVIDEEAAVWRSVAGLNGTEVCAEDVGLRVVFGHFEGPFCGAGADVEDAAGGGGADWGAVEVAAD